MEAYIRFNRSFTVDLNQTKEFSGNGNTAVLSNVNGVYDLNLNTDSFINIGSAPSAGSIVHYTASIPQLALVIEGQPPVLTED